MEKFKQRIAVRNLGPLKEVDIELDKIMVFIGQQASGKSTLAKLIYFFKSVDQIFDDIYLNNRSGRNPFETPQAEIIFNARTKFTHFFGSSLDLSPKFYAKFWYKSNSSLEITLNKKKEIKFNFSKPFSDIIFLVVKNLQLNFNPTTFSETEAVNLLRNWGQAFNANLPQFFTPAGRNIVVTFSRHFQQLLFEAAFKNSNSTTPFSGANEYLIIEFMKKINKIIDGFNGGGFEEIAAKYEALTGKPNKYKELALTKINKILRGKYQNAGTGEFLIPKNSKQKVSLTDASSGQQESIRILQDLFLSLIKEESIGRFIEEPEAHLFPTAQKNMVDFFVLFANAGNNQLTLTTHSPYILSAFNNLLYATRVAETDPDSTSELINPALHLSPTDFAAYELKNGKIRSIIDSEIGLIAENYLDEISEDLGDEFDELQRILAAKMQD